MFAIAVLNSKTREKPKAWITLGFITDFLLIGVNKKLTDMRHQDYHNIMGIILSSFITAQ